MAGFYRCRPRLHAQAEPVSGEIATVNTMRCMAQVPKHIRPEEERRRQAAERMRGLFADLAPGRSLSDELIAERRAEAHAEDREAAEEAQRLRGKR